MHTQRRFVGAVLGLRRAEGERKRERNLAPPLFCCMWASTYTRSRARVLWELKAVDLDLDQA